MNTTPFRYPGAKNKLLPIILNNLKDIIINDGTFTDAFVGGGSVLLAVAEKYPKVKLFVNDKDYWIYSFWKVVSGPSQEDFEELIDMVTQKVTIDLFYSLREDRYKDHVRCAYKALFFNRTTFSGIFYSGPIGGKKQSGKYTVDCRYNPKMLRHKLIICRNLLIGRTEVFNDDFADFKMLTETNEPIYLDPPYVDAGKSLYTHYMDEEDHFLLKDILSNRQKWVLSYDNTDIIKRIYYKCNITIIDGNYSIKGIKSTWSQKSELIITPKFLQENVLIVE